MRIRTPKPDSSVLLLKSKNWDSKTVVCTQVVYLSRFNPNELGLELTMT